MLNSASERRSSCPSPGKLALGSLHLRVTASASGSGRGEGTPNRESPRNLRKRSKHNRAGKRRSAFRATVTARRAPSPSRTELCAGQTVNGSLPGGGAPWVLIALWLTKARRNHFRPMSGPKLVDPARSGTSAAPLAGQGKICYKPLKNNDILSLINCPFNRT